MGGQKTLAVVDILIQQPIGLLITNVLHFK